MSLFLAPIHQVMYDKIHYTDDLATALAEKDPSTARALEENFPSIEKEPLEAVIDKGNIHGWLAERVVLAEKRLAFAACALAKKDRVGLFEAVKDFGRKEAFSGSAEEAFFLYDSRFLNGMPCDRIHMPEDAEEGFAWRITRDVHGEYYDEADLYDALIAAWWEGLLKKSELNYFRDGNLCTVK